MLQRTRIPFLVLLLGLAVTAPVFGRVRALVEEATRLGQADPRRDPRAAQLRRLGADFQIKELRAMLQACADAARAAGDAHDPPAPDV